MPMLIRFALSTAPSSELMPYVDTMSKPADPVMNPEAKQLCFKSSSSWASQYDTITIGGFYPNPFKTFTYWSSVLAWPSTEHVTFMTCNATTTNPALCCGACRINWLDVTLKYWPQPGASTGCLRSIGSDGQKLRTEIAKAMRALTTSNTARNTSNPANLYGDCNIVQATSLDLEASGSLQVANVTWAGGIDNISTAIIKMIDGVS